MYVFRKIGETDGGLGIGETDMSENGARIVALDKARMQAMADRDVWQNRGGRWRMVAWPSTGLPD